MHSLLVGAASYRLSLTICADQEVHPVVAAQIVSHTTDTDMDTKCTNYLGSAQTKYTWHDGRYARAHMDRGGLIHAHLEGVGLKARPLTTDSRYQTESFMSPTICTRAKRQKPDYTS